ncbi:MAG TPA: hypothetical protein VL357_09255 [Rariglobus sp.]|jgi:hypothetical protein|nr:hypothetical protein [Rariglobus sp.]
MKPLKILSVFILAGTAALTSRADDARFQASLWAPDHQLVPATDSVSGFRLEIYGENKNMTGLEIGLVNVTTGDFTGFTGLLPTIYNRVDGITKGVQFGVVNKTKGEVTGWQNGWINFPESKVTGLQNGIVNWNGKGTVDLSGVQFGFVNASKHVTGLQIGLVNYAQTLKGVQIGLWNQVDSRNWDEFHPLPKVFPIINLGF